MTAAFVLLLFATGTTEQPDRLRTASAVRALSRPQAAERRPVELAATVTHANPVVADCFVQDETAGIYIDPTPLTRGLTPGDRVVVVGVTDPGTFAPMVVASAIRKVGRGPLPSPEVHSLDPDDNRWLDARYVEVRAFVQNVPPPTAKAVTLDIATAKGSARVILPKTDADYEAAKAFVGAVVRVRAVCGSPRHDPTTGAADRVGRLYASSLSAVERLPDETSTLAPIPVANVTRGFTPGPNPFARPVTVRGVVTAAVMPRPDSQVVVVQDESGGAVVYPSYPAAVRPGETVLVRGYHAPKSRGVVLDNAVLGPWDKPLPPPAAVPTTADQVVRDGRWGTLVRIDGEVRSAVLREGELRVTCADGPQSFVIVHAADGLASPLGRLEPGTRVAATGVPVPVEAAPGDEPGGFRLLVPDAAHVAVVAGPPAGWWTADRVARLLLALSVLAVAVGVWIYTLRRQVRRQADALRAHYERDAELERKLLESRRLEAIGRLVGGIAHDFNNLLTVIIGGSNLAADAARDHPAAAEYLRSVLLAGERAADLTNQLLTFSRRKTVAVEPIDLNAALREIEKLVRPAVGDSVQVVTDYDADAPDVVADRGLLTQVVLNLATNARDAMPAGGRLEVRTRVVEADGRPVVRLTVADTGCGMDAATAARIFDPFFTTKAVGKGTGLGLATVYGIVHDLNGTIAVRSAVGKGTTFAIDLPPAPRSGVRPAAAAAADAPRVTATGPVLLVDDEPSVRMMSAAVMRRYGLTVVEADTADDALRLVREAAEPFAVMVTDVVMPDRSGPQLAAEVRLVCPALRVLFISGYDREELANPERLREGDRFLQKPFTPTHLIAQLQEMFTKPAG
jgi:signal transduction histidine kinase